MKKKNVWIKPDLSEVLQPENGYQVSVLFGETPEEMGNGLERKTPVPPPNGSSEDKDQRLQGSLLVLKSRRPRTDQEASMKEYMNS